MTLADPTPGEGFGLEESLTLAAFLVAVVALYLSNLKRADISLDLLPTEQAPTLLQFSVIEGCPVGANVVLNASAYNSGARGGVLVDVQLGSLHEGGQVFAPKQRLRPTERDGRWAVPAALEGGDVTVLLLSLELASPLDDDHSRDTLQSIRNLLPPVMTLDIRYTFLKGRSLLPWRWHQAVTVERKLIVNLSLERFREQIDSTLSDLGGDT